MKQEFKCILNIGISPFLMQCYKLQLRVGLFLINAHPKLLGQQVSDDGIGTR